MRVLTFSDHHAYAWKPYSTVLPDGVNSRLHDGNYVLAQVRELAVKEQVDLILFGGDLFHARGSIHVQTFNLVYDEIAKMRLHCPVGMLVGNHDQTNKDGDVHSIYAMRSVVTVMDKAGWYEFDCAGLGGPCQVLAIPYHPDREVLVKQIERLAGQRATSLYPTIMLGHFGIDGAVVGGNFVLRDKHAVKISELNNQHVDMAFLGHYHEPQQLAQNVYYIGATHQHNWGDSGQERGCMIWDTGENDEYAEPTFFHLAAPQFKKIPFGATVEPEEVTDHYIRVVAGGNISKSVVMQVEESLLAHGAKSVEFISEADDQGMVSGTSFQTAMDMDEMLASYVDEVSVQHPFLQTDRLREVGSQLLREVP